MKNKIVIPEINYAIPTSQPGLKILTTTVFATMLLGVTNSICAEPYQPIGGNQIPLWEVNSLTGKELELPSKVDDLYLLDIYMEPKPIKSYKIKSKFRTIRQGHAQLFPSEFEQI